MSYLRHFEELELKTSEDILDGVIEDVPIRGLIAPPWGI